MADAREWQIKALTPIWTGRVTKIEERRRGNRTELREVIDSDRLISTGLLGSIRWWFEVLVRGLGGSACDPTKDGTRCPDARKKPGEPGHHCVVCELFGCTGWARKFRFQVLAGTQGDEIQSGAIQKDAQFRLRFIPLRDIAPEEWALLDLTLRLIAEYGAIGGKTVLKPSDEPSRAAQQHHRDYGIIAIESPLTEVATRRELEAHVRDGKWRSVQSADFAWASLENFWCVSHRHLYRKDADVSSFNRVLGRLESKKCRDCGEVHDPPQKCQKTKKHPRRHSDGVPNDDAGRWLAGRQQESKKVFSFKSPPRTFGFVNPPTVDFAQIKKRLAEAWTDLTDDEFLKGDAILARLLSNRAGTS